jgi:hypothetical protein
MNSEPTMSDMAPIGGALYRHTARRGRWRLETAGPKWISFRSLDVVGQRGYFVTFKERREDWPNGWMRA